MKPEPLRGKIMYEHLVYTDNSNFGDRDNVIEQYQELAKNFKSAVEFFKRYRDKPELFTKETNMYFHDDVEGFCIFKQMIEDGEFNHWLLDHAFSDIVEGRDINDKR